ncbi:LOW QUALITY PROTEIN: hypothetical protein HID58_079568, partial [Brassica napus]
MYCLLGFLQFFNHAMGKLTSLVILLIEHCLILWLKLDRTSYLLSFGFCVDRANVYAEKKENRMMMTGLHTVADIYFVKCGSYVGWRYEFAFEKNQQYKEGKSILE